MKSSCTSAQEEIIDNNYDEESIQHAIENSDCHIYFKLLRVYFLLIAEEFQKAESLMFEYEDDPEMTDHYLFALNYA